MTITVKYDKQSVSTARVEFVARVFTEFETDTPSNLRATLKDDGIEGNFLTSDCNHWYGWDSLEGSWLHVYILQSKTI